MVKGKNGNGKRATEKTATEETATGKLGNWKNRQRKNERVGKQGNTKITSKITATEKRQRKNGNGNCATENWATRKFGNET